MRSAENNVSKNQLHRATGTCACGQVSFSCLIEDEVALCSCSTCRRSSGSAFQAWVNGDRGSLAVRGDTTWWPSSNHAVRSYCTNCGSPLFLFEADDPLVVEVAAGSLDAPDEIKSARRSYEDEQPRWGR